jgi:thiol:disulfide interchange protein DsbA
MSYLRRLVATFGMGMISIAVSASPAAPVNGVDYRTLSAVQQTRSGKKVEVIEFFGYFCSYCYSFDPLLTEWARKQGKNIVFKRVHVAFGKSMEAQQRMFYALEAMGKLEVMHGKIFHALHIEKIRLNNESAVVDFVVKQGVDKGQFIDLYNSFSVQSSAANATKMQGDYKIDGVPMVAIDGRFITSPSIVGAGLGRNQSEAALQSATLTVMDALVAKVRKERNLDTKSASVVTKKKALAK